MLELWFFGGKSLQKGSSFIWQIKMINTVTNNATKKRPDSSPLNVPIDLAITTWFVSICCKHKLNQITHWSCALGGICHSFVDEDKLISSSMPIEERCIIFFFFLSWLNFSNTAFTFCLESLKSLPLRSKQEVVSQRVWFLNHHHC